MVPTTDLLADLAQEYQRSRLFLAQLEESFKPSHIATVPESEPESEPKQEPEPKDDPPSAPDPSFLQDKEETGHKTQIASRFKLKLAKLFGHKDTSSMQPRNTKSKPISAEQDGLIPARVAIVNMGIDAAHPAESLVKRSASSALQPTAPPSAQLNRFSWDMRNPPTSQEEGHEQYYQVDRGHRRASISVCFPPTSASQTLSVGQLRGIGITRPEAGPSSSQKHLNPSKTSPGAGFPDIPTLPAMEQHASHQHQHRQVLQRRASSDAHGPFIPLAAPAAHGAASASPPNTTQTLPGCLHSCTTQHPTSETMTAFQLPAEIPAMAILPSAMRDPGRQLRGRSLSRRSIVIDPLALYSSSAPSGGPSTGSTLSGGTATATATITTATTSGSTPSSTATCSSLLQRQPASTVGFGSPPPSSPLPHALQRSATAASTLPSPTSGAALRGSSFKQSLHRGSSGYTDAAAASVGSNAASSGAGAGGAARLHAALPTSAVAAAAACAEVAAGAAAAVVELDAAGLDGVAAVAGSPTQSRWVHPSQHAQQWAAQQQQAQHAQQGGLAQFQFSATPMRSRSMRTHRNSCCMGQQLGYVMPVPVGALTASGAVTAAACAAAGQQPLQPLRRHSFRARPWGVQDGEEGPSALGGATVNDGVGQEAAGAAAGSWRRSSGSEGAQTGPCTCGLSSPPQQQLSQAQQQWASQHYQSTML